MRNTKVQLLGIASFLMLSLTAVSQQILPNKYFVKGGKKNITHTQLLQHVNGGEVVKTGTNDFLVYAPNTPQANLYQTLQNQLGVIYISPLFGRGNYFAANKGRIVIKLVNPSYAQNVEALCIQLGLTDFASAPLLPNTWFANENMSSEATDVVCKTLLNSGYVTFAEPDILFTPIVPSITPNDPLFNRQWNLLNDGSSVQYNGTPGADMKVTEAWEVTTGSPAIKIAIMDSGTDTLHPDLMPNLLPGFDANSDSIDTRGYPTPNFDEDGHGTCCAGICAAAYNNSEGTAGVAPGCKIIPIRMFYYLSFGGQTIPLSSSVDAATGINWARQIANADIISNSWGVPDSLIPFLGEPQVVIDAINYAVVQGRAGKGITLLFSSGNDNLPINLIPARVQNVIAVGATSMCDERKNPQSCDNESWWGGNYGDSLDISAPGVRVPAPDMLGTRGFVNGNYYSTFNGTSAACPNAAGVLALIYSVNPNLTYSQARYILENTADRTGGYDYSSNKASGSWSYELGYGRVNALKAVQAAQATVGINKINTADYKAFISYDNNGQAYINVNAEQPSTITVSIYDLTGKMVQSVYNAPNTKELINVPLNIQVQGLYMVRLTVGNESSTIKAIIRK